MNTEYEKAVQKRSNHRNIANTGSDFKSCENVQRYVGATGYKSSKSIAAKLNHSLDFNKNI